MSASTAPVVNSPPSRNKWKAVTLNVIGVNSSMASALRPTSMSAITRLHISANEYEMYTADATVNSMKANAASVLYKSLVGSPKAPVAPITGKAQIRANTIFSIR